MTCWQLLLFALLQVQTDAPGTTVPARDAELSGVLVKQVPLSELQERIARTLAFKAPNFTVVRIARSEAQKFEPPNTAPTRQIDFRLASCWPAVDNGRRKSV